MSTGAADKPRRLENTVSLVLKSCKECPHFRRDGYYTADSFEYCEELTCQKKKKQIAIVDWDEKMPPIPKWCPLRKANAVLSGAAPKQPKRG